MAVAWAAATDLSDSTPSLGTSICHGCGPKNTKKKKKKKKNECAMQVSEGKALRAKEIAGSKAQGRAYVYRFSSTSTNKKGLLNKRLLNKEIFGFESILKL